MKVAMIPASGTANPYVTLLRNALAGASVDVTGLSTRAALTSPPAILHYHWPQNVVARRSFAGGLKNAAATLARIAWLKRRGTRIVWTVHNLQSHSARSRSLERMYMAAFTRMLDGLIFLDPVLRGEAIRRFPHLAGTSWEAIPHGVYGAPESTESKAHYRSKFALPESGPVVGFIGDIHPYKGISSALDALNGDAADKPTLFIAGTFSDASEERAVRARLAELSAAGLRVVHIDRRLDDTELVEAMLACDALLLPYRSGSNSGLAVRALELEIPLLCSDLPMFHSMHEELGSHWVRILPEWTAAELQRALKSARRPADLDSLESFLAIRQWENVAALTRNFYRHVRKQRPRPAD